MFGNIRRRKRNLMARIKRVQNAMKRNWNPFLDRLKYSLPRKLIKVLFF